jgi:hypothetical protein
MIDVEREIREALQRHELEVPSFDRSDVPRLLRRTRTRQVANAVGTVLMAGLLALGITTGVTTLLRAEGGRPADDPSPTPPTAATLVPPEEAPIVVGSGSADGWAWVLSASVDGACVALTDAQGSELSCSGEGAEGVANDVVTVDARSPQEPAPPLLFVFGRVPPRTSTVWAGTFVLEPTDGELFAAPEGVRLNAGFYVRWIPGYPYPFVPDVIVYATGEQGEFVGADRDGVTLERPIWATPATHTVLEVIATAANRVWLEDGSSEPGTFNVSIFRDEATGRVCLGEIGSGAVCGPAADPVPAWQAAIASYCEAPDAYPPTCGWPPLNAMSLGGATAPSFGAASWGWGLVGDPLVTVRAERSVLNERFGTDRDGWLEADIYDLPAEYGAPFRVWVYSCDDCLTGGTVGLDADGNEVVALN